MLLVVCRLLPPNHLIPTEKLFLFLFPSEMLCVSVSLHPLGGAEHKVTSFLIHAGSVYTTCVLFLFLQNGNLQQNRLQGWYFKVEGGAVGD